MDLYNRRNKHMICRWKHAAAVSVALFVSGCCSPELPAVPPVQQPQKLETSVADLEQTARNYLSECGMSEAEIDRLRAVLEGKQSDR